MKVLKIVIAGAFVVLFFSNFKEASINFENNLINVYFSNRLEIGDLAKIKSDLSEKGIKLNYDYLKFADNGKLNAIKYNVKAGKFGGGDEADNLKNEIGFIINTNPVRKYDIIVGTKEQIQKRKIFLETQNK